ncbi:hypothetical protein [Demetria terragena]|uniref:hypothetical protein n=1 Tax=Demetria terragena TaxID=63959 RepID=UPI000360EC8F
MDKPVGNITRGTTAPNRLRRCDRWIAGTQGWRLRACPRPIAVDLGYGASPITALELHDRLHRVRSDVQVVGIEISPERVAAGKPFEREGVRFKRGGFEVPLGGDDATIIRAFNVLRQYDEGQVADAWARLTSRISPQGLVVDGTCDEIGRLASWVALDRSGPRSLTMAFHLGSLEDPATVAERLPKALIHRNIPGEPIHQYLQAWQVAWRRANPLASYGARQRFIASAQALRADGWPLLDDARRWRLGEATVDWSAVAPAR